MKQLTEKEFIKLYNELSIKELAEYCDVHRMTIQRWAKILGLPLKRKYSLIKK